MATKFHSTRVYHQGTVDRSTDLAISNTDVLGSCGRPLQSTTAEVITRIRLLRSSAEVQLCKVGHCGILVNIFSARWCPEVLAPKAVTLLKPITIPTFFLTGQTCAANIESQLFLPTVYHTLAIRLLSIVPEALVLQATF